MSTFVSSHLDINRHTAVKLVFQCYNSRLARRSCHHCIGFKLHCRNNIRPVL